MELTPSQAPNGHHDPEIQQPTRPGIRPRTASQIESQYVNMLLALDDIPQYFSWLANFFTWILLAGFLIFPGTFTSLQEEQESGHLNPTEALVYHAVKNVSLFVIAFICCGVGASGMGWLWWRWQKNYIWLLDRIFLPGFLNSLAGVISMLVNLFGAHHGALSASSETTLIVISVSTGICGFLTAYYSLWKLRLVKVAHERQIGRERAGKHGEGYIEPASHPKEK
ncbi:hypothetical protein JAAARDRAFT_139558 [Jaapia argillacea MUCL 33604]|uniref:Uncharacterized protein n=1 Tax=Jaapia argillacea MUCL 33604 TaxID=933084 RepID=A0A067PAM1_9AGAM|nr:hypothetical protein JAAARDRAFT_139558 [Jaapia argillacea MUCL 33604]